MDMSISTYIYVIWFCTGYVIYVCIYPDLPDTLMYIYIYKSKSRVYLNLCNLCIYIHIWSANVYTAQHHIYMHRCLCIHISFDFPSLVPYLPLPSPPLLRVSIATPRLATLLASAYVLHLSMACTCIWMPACLWYLLTVCFSKTLRNMNITCPSGAYYIAHTATSLLRLISTDGLVWAQARLCIKKGGNVDRNCVGL